MIDWSSPAEIKLDSTVWNDLSYACCGMYVWEFLISLDFDFAFLTGKRKWTWALLPYFIGRYVILSLAMVGTIVGPAPAANKHYNCEALYTYYAFAGDVAVGMSTISLSLRALALWSDSWTVTCSLALLTIGHWLLIIWSCLLSARFVPDAGCTITHDNLVVIGTMFVYSMVLDLVVMLLVIRKVLFPYAGWTPMVRLLFTDGLLYFAVAVIVNLIGAVFWLLQLNPVMNVILLIPKAIFCTVAANRVVRRLMNRFGGNNERARSQIHPASLPTPIFASRNRPTMDFVSMAPSDAEMEQTSGLVASPGPHPSGERLVGSSAASDRKRTEDAGLDAGLDAPLWFESTDSRSAKAPSLDDAQSRV